MSIAPNSDLIMDVVRAADPRRAESAKLALDNQAAPARDPLASSIERKQFDALLHSAKSSTAASMTAKPIADASTSVSSTVLNRASTSSGNAVADAYRALGGLLVQKMIESALPHGKSASFTKGIAGDAWNSLLAEHVAKAASPKLFNLKPVSHSDKS